MTQPQEPTTTQLTQTIHALTTAVEHLVALVLDERRRQPSRSERTRTQEARVRAAIQTARQAIPGSVNVPVQPGPQGAGGR